MNVSGLDYALLFTGSSAPAAGGDPLAALRLAQKNETRDVAREAKTPEVARDIAAFQKGVTGAKTIGEALRNPDVLKVLLTANGLGDQVNYPALAQKALLSDPGDPASLANKLASTAPGWLATAKAYDFAKNGLAALQDNSVQSSLTQAYAEIQWQQSLDKTTPGLSNALQFLRQAGSITSVDQILGDKVNRAVVLTALGIPQQVAFQPLATQEKAVSSRLDIGKLQNPKFVTGLTDQYLLAMRQQSAGSTAAPGSNGLMTLAVQVRGLVV